MSYDATRDTEEYRRHWANADAFDANSANSKAVRLKGMQRSRYEAGSNGMYAGILRTQCNLVIGIGPRLRMTTKNKNFNDFVEKEFGRWATRIQLRRKLWCMAHARLMDGEAFALMQTNPAIPMGRVQLDLTLIEADQVQTPYGPFDDPNYTDGIKRDQYGNVLWYDVLKYHPGASQALLNTEAIRVSPRQMLHWSKLERPGECRSMPACISTLNLGASARRFREATLRKAEIQADFAVLLESTLPPEDGLLPEQMSSYEIEKAMMTMLPDGTKPSQLKVDTPSAQYREFNDSHISETARPISQARNVAAMDSSNSSFASGKLDYIAGNLEVDVEREDCTDQVLDPLFEEWFAEWSLVDPRDQGAPDHRWDFPAHPVIDVKADALARDTNLRNGTLTLRQAYNDQGYDFEEKLVEMAEDYFGDSSDANVKKMREILLYTHYAQAAPRNAPALPGTESAAPAAQPVGATK